MAAARAAPARDAETETPRQVCTWGLLTRRDCNDARVLWLEAMLLSMMGMVIGPAKRSRHS